MDQRVLWHDGVTWPDTGRTAVPDRVDVLVVGAGYCGLAAAAAAAGAGATVCVVDRGGPGDGASSRNGGMVIPELKLSPAALEKRFGDLGRRLQRDVEDAFDLVEDLTGPGGIDCAYERTGQLYLAHNGRAADRLDEMARTSAGTARVLRGAALAAEIGSTRFPAGLLSERTGGLQPARFHAGLMRRALDAGATVIHHTEVTSIERTAGGNRAVTSRGEVSASRVLVATNAATSGLGAVRRRVLPVGSFIVATEPLDEDVAASLLPGRRMCFDTKNFLWYWRVDPQHRLVFGGRRSLGATTLDEAAAFLRRSISEVYPQLGPVEIDACWGGVVAITLDRLPHAGIIDGLHYATGCNGSGVALNTWLGDRMGRVVVGEAELPACAELRHRPIPAFALRDRYLPLVGRWFEWQDRR